MEQAPAAVAELHAAPEAAPAAVEPAAPPAGRIEDFGETLHGARKHYAQQYAERMRLAETLPVAKHSLSETWPEPNYAKLIEDGADPFLVALAHASRDEIPAKPRSGWKVKGWADQVQTLRDFSNSMLDGTLRAADVRAGLEKSPELRQVYGRAAV